MLHKWLHTNAAQRIPNGLAPLTEAEQHDSLAYCPGISMPTRALYDPIEPAPVLEALVAATAAATAAAAAACAAVWADGAGGRGASQAALGRS